MAKIHPALPARVLLTDEARQRDVRARIARADGCAKVMVRVWAGAHARPTQYAAAVVAQQEGVARQRKLAAELTLERRTAEHEARALELKQALADERMRALRDAETGPDDQ